ncbi:GNAT family N-acetyltransferase [Alkalicoccus daliensis]|uniref:Acetyltransferase (GNAT) family protein n=1 Tax=Alkalicoccus daliensis TaxID=745820 RepID=A0A1H0HJT4_9BACI|nr:GNAT family N-acetyltransferase [Alkalicoccus daliensis]SDO19479.1 Acetyltransferase (GNAT) family protein [Alkalicoccus daliensis]
MSVLIREAAAEEVSFIREQRLQAYEDHRNAVPEEHWQALKKAITSEADSQPGVELFVAEKNDKIIGSIALFPALTDAYEGMTAELDYPEIRVLAVAPEARGKGAASALIAACIQRAKEKGYNYIGLHTGEFMHEAIALYQKHGFERQPEHDFEPAGDGVTVKAFRLSLEQDKRG